MEIWLSMEKERLRLPVLPPTFEVASSNMNERVNINEIGNINIIGKTDLKEISLSSFFPNQSYHFVEYNDFPKPYECIDILERWKTSDKPIRLIITDTNINLSMLIESFAYGENDGTGDAYYSLELAEYKHLKIKTKAKKTKYEPPKTKRPAPTPKRKTYIVKRGDNLWNISKRFTGNPMNYKKIAKENKIKNPNLIFPGQKLVI